MTTKEKLIAARKLIAAGWCQGESARNVDGEVVSIHSPDAVSFCATGAVRVVTPDHYDSGPVHALACALPELFQGHEPEGDAVIVYNDIRGATQDDILSLFDRAIKEAR